MTATATAIVARKNDFVLTGPVGSFDAYMDKVSRIPVLSREDEADLAKRFRNEGDLEAARQLVLSHLRFVVHFGLRPATRRCRAGGQCRPHEGGEALRP